MDLSLSPEQQSLYDAHVQWAESRARIAAKHLPGSFDLEDLKQAACIGLCKAAGRYDPAKNDNFKAWATLYVGNEIGMFIRRRNYKEATHSELPQIMRAKDDATQAKLDGIAGIIVDHERQAQACMGEALTHKIAIGHRLIEAKELLEHGQWGAWLEANFRWTPRHAQHHMKLARNAKRVSHLVVLDGSMRAALAVLRQAKCSGEVCYLLVGILKEQPGPEAEPMALVSNVLQWKVAHRKMNMPKAA